MGAAGRHHQGSFAVEATDPDLAFVLEIDTEVRLHDGSPDSDVPVLRGRAVDLVEALSTRTALPASSIPAIAPARRHLPQSHSQLITESAEELAMSIQSTARIESVPQTWNDETDSAFFTIVARLFCADFAYGAGVLLATFDSSDAATSGEATAAVALADGAVAAPADLSSEVVAVAVRRSR